MEHNNKLKQTLREEFPLSNDLEWEQMQEGIFEQMAQPNQERRGLFFFLHWKKLLGAALLVLNFSVMAYLIYLVQEKEELGAFPIPVKYKIAESNLNNKQTTAKFEETRLNILEKEEIAGISSKESIFITEQKNYKKSSDEKTLIPKDFEQATLIYKQDNIGESIITLEGLGLNHQEKEFGSLTSSTKLLESQVHNLNTTSLKIERPIFVPYYALEISGGTNNWKSNYNITLAEQNARSKSETELWGYQLAANSKYYFKSNLYAAIGLEFQQLNNRFNYENTRVDQVEARSALVGIAINSISGDSTFIRQDVLVNVEEKRKVQHYNRHQILTIQLRLGYEWRHNRFALSGSIGSVFSIQSFSKGKTLVGSEITNYDQSNPIYKKRFGMGLSTSLQLNYALTKDIYIGGNVGHTNWLSNWSKEQEIQLRPNIGQFSLVLGKRF